MSEEPTSMRSREWTPKTFPKSDTGLEDKKKAGVPNLKF
jgi:hypothetical protein